MDVKRTTDIHNFRNPTCDALQECENREDFEELEVPEDGLFFPGSANFLLAPFLVNAVNKADTDDCFELIRVLIATAGNFDTEHLLDANFPVAK